jgi:myo-inositol-1(or 4)-monophosphatase
MPESDNGPTLQEVEQLARNAGSILRDRYGKEHDLGMKGEVDFATEADHLAEEFILNHIRDRYPSHHMVAEETGSNHIVSEHAWYIDPLDGTINFAHGIPMYCVSIAYAFRGKVKIGVVYDPSRDECFSAEDGKGARLNGDAICVSKTQSLRNSLLVTGFPSEINSTYFINLDHFSYFAVRTRGVRHIGSAAIDLCYVASGRVDAFWELILHPWDYAAGGLIAHEAGAIVTTTDGLALTYGVSSPILAATPALHQEILKVLLTQPE